MLKNCALSVREMLESAVVELKEKGYTDANDANALGSRATDGKQGNSSNKNTDSSDNIWITVVLLLEMNYLVRLGMRN